MIIINGVILQAIGIVLEGLGLVIALGAFGTYEKRWLREFRESRDYFPQEHQLRKEGFQFSTQIILIGLGLIFQLIGLFV